MQTENLEMLQECWRGCPFEPALFQHLTSEIAPWAKEEITNQEAEAHSHWSGLTFLPTCYLSFDQI